MDEIKNGNFPEPRSRQEMYLQDIIGELAKDSSVSEKAYPEPRSRQEFYTGNEYSDVDESAPYPYFANYSDYTSPNTEADKNRIKYKNGAPQWWWGRTPSSGGAYSVRDVLTTGQLYNTNASITGGGVLACNII